MSISKSDLRSLYRQRAGNYDFTANLYYLIGYREWAYRRMAVRALQLEPGDTVVEIACGTGLNFDLYEERIGPTGRVIGVDLTDSMLDQARERTTRRGWTNVELIESDAASFHFPGGVDAIISTFAITLMSDFDTVIRNGARALRTGGRFAILDLKRPDWPPQWLVEAFVRITRPFGVSLDMADRHPWESLDRYLSDLEFRELYLGFSYLAVATARPDSLAAATLSAARSRSR